MPLPTSKRSRPRGAESAWRTIRIVAGVFSLVVAVVMLARHLNVNAIDPLKSPELKELKERLRLNPADESSKQAIRGLDLELRARYFRQLAQSASGAWLLIAGMAVFVAAGVQCARLPRPWDRTASSTGSRWKLSTLRV
jgi:cytochrome c-type biogenesis protein CcmH/NrfG